MQNDSIIYADYFHCFYLFMRNNKEIKDTDLCYLSNRDLNNINYDRIFVDKEITLVPFFSRFNILYSFYNEKRNIPYGVVD